MLVEEEDKVQQVVTKVIVVKTRPGESVPSLSKAPHDAMPVPQHDHSAVPESVPSPSNGSIADDRVVDVPSPSKARNDASGACMYHPDLGYVGDGPPATEAAAASFALRAREPAFFWLYIYICTPCLSSLFT